MDPVICGFLLCPVLFAAFSLYKRNARGNSGVLGVVGVKVDRPWQPAGGIVFIGFSYTHAWVQVSRHMSEVQAFL